MGDAELLLVCFGYQSKAHQAITVTIAIVYFVSAGVAMLALKSTVAFWQLLKQAADAIL